MAIKKKDFIKITYTGKLKDGTVFDTTDEKVAQENGIHNPQVTYGPATICVGQNQVIPGLDADLEGKEPGEYEISLTAENAFGKKDAKLVQLIPTGKFKKDNINPMPGLQVNIDGHVGIIKTVSGGRTLVDFNHPLSGQDVVYSYKIESVVDDVKDKIKATLKMALGQEGDVSEKDGKYTVTMEKLPEQLFEPLAKNVKDTVGVDVTFSNGSASEKKA